MFFIMYKCNSEQVFAIISVLKSMLPDAIRIAIFTDLFSFLRSVTNIYTKNT